MVQLMMRKEKKKRAAACLVEASLVEEVWIVDAESRAFLAMNLSSTYLKINGTLHRA
jgi:hypothetical protein